jgi:deazaflavin-dependent oxidoreductase (nitroreductase family)
MSLLSHVLAVHERIYIATDGWIGHRLVGVPTLLLRTTGRRSGRERTNSLVYARDGEDLVVVASNGGADRNPAWLHNLRATPKVEVQIGRRRRPATARILTPGDPDYERLWTLADGGNGGRYAAYQRQTERPIPVVVLTPG